MSKLFPVVLPIFLLSCRALEFYGDPAKPIYVSGEKEMAAAAPADSLNLVTFNIKKSRKIDLAIAEMTALERQSPVDILLLQEMDEKGVEAIAAGLNLNYLYIPISYDKADKKDIGNAILTKGAIAHPEKLILPHAKWQNQQRRGVTVGEITIREKKILVFNVHTETVAMSRRMRMDQVDSIVRYAKTASSRYKYILIGGDFNTAFPAYSAKVVSAFNTSGFDCLTPNVGSTAKAIMGLVTPRNDYLFSTGFAGVNAYAVRTSKSSDHYPVFATVRYTEQPPPAHLAEKGN